MTDRTLIENRISSVKKYLDILQRYQQFSREEVGSDVDTRGMVERYLYLAAQSCIDLAEALVSYKELRKPTTMAETFYILQENGIIDKELAEKMAKMTGFRNLLSHDYENMDYDIVYDILQNGPGDIKEFADQAASRLNRE